MADVRPFRAAYYDSDNAGSLGSLVCPPYDVISDDERAGYLARSPHNAVHLILPEVAYDQVAGLIADWMTSGALVRSEQPMFVAWTQTFQLPGGGERTRNTLVGAVKVAPYEARVVRPHERTHRGPKEDRLRLTRAVRTNLSPVFGLYPDEAGAAWAAAGITGPPLAELTDVDGVVHRIWHVTDAEACAAVHEALADKWILIADGHHRYETALAYRNERAEAEGDIEYAPWQRVMMGLTSLDDDGLEVLPTHRVLASWPGGRLDAFTATAIESPATMVEALAEAPAEVTAIGLATAHGLTLLTAPKADTATPGERLDVAVLEREILVPTFGADQAKLSADGVLTYTKDALEAMAMVAEGRAGAAAILRPIPKPDVAAVAEAGETMPQKSTYFFPKLLTGMAFHPLDK